jgi:hypothetical protein
MSAAEPDLNDHELTVLAIAAEGEAMIPLGQWEQAVDRLVALGYLARTPHPGDPTGKFNCRITERGKVRAAAQEDEEVLAFLQLNNLMVQRKESADAGATDEGRNVVPRVEDRLRRDEPGTARDLDERET